MCPRLYILNGYTNATEDISGGDYVFVTCNHGYTLIGSPVVPCDLNGMYTSLLHVSLFFSEFQIKPIFICKCVDYFAPNIYIL
jgi:hypothetical protein